MKNISVRILLFLLFAVAMKSLRPKRYLASMQIQSPGLPVRFSSKPTASISDVLIQPHLKLPVWPVYGGVLAQLFDWMGIPRAADNILSKIGGRVVPMSLNELGLSPFLLLVHHSHSFLPFDPIRPITNLVLPEGFPAHSHSGFGTLTITLEGGLKHRDSEGVKMTYGNGDAQWMRAGKGVIHEEMWDIPKDKFQKIEIFQLWLNIPSTCKYSEPLVDVLKQQEIPEVIIDETGSKARILYGDVNIERMEGLVIHGPGNRVAESPLCIMHLSLTPGTCQNIVTPPGASCVVYIQKGALTLPSPRGVDEVSMGNLAIFKRSTAESTAIITAGSDGLECLVLIGSPLAERAIMGGPFVAASENELNRIANVWSSIGRAAYWDYLLSDDEWTKHIKSLNLQDKLKSLTKFDSAFFL